MQIAVGDWSQQVSVEIGWNEHRSVQGLAPARSHPDASSEQSKKLNQLIACSVRNYERSKSDEVTAMTIQAETLAQLTKALQERGMKLVTDVAFTRAPYRQNHRWICIVE